MLTVLVGGAIANKYLNGGEAWVRLSWALGLKRLGCRVFLVEQIDPAMCVGQDGEAAPFSQSATRAYFDRIMIDFGLDGAASLVVGAGEETSGLSFEELLDVAADADLLVNISGHLEIDELVRRPRRRAYVDLDPGFTQFWHVAGTTGARLEGHDVYFTVGENIGTDTCTIPTGGIDWRPVPPPVVLEEWPASADGAPERFTTVGAWRGAFGPVVYEGTTYGLKVHEFRKVIDLPQRAPEATFEIALEIHSGDAKDRDALVERGWHLTDPRLETPGPGEFRSYVQHSGAEFSVAQGIYVETNSGWFSDRTVRYLASGKPVLVQDTGFSRNYPVGEGLVAFRSVDEAAEGAARIGSSYASHAAAARAIAEKHFDSDRVLARFLDEALG